MENYRICNSCGQGFTYTDEEFKRSMRDAALSGFSSLGAAVGAFTGNYGATIANQNAAAMSAPRDYT